MCRRRIDDDDEDDVDDDVKDAACVCVNGNIIFESDKTAATATATADSYELCRARVCEWKNVRATHSKYNHRANSEWCVLCVCSQNLTTFL